jgi:cytochrome c oxidase subunit II
MGLLNRLMGIPDLASEHGEIVDNMLEFVHWFMAILFVGWSIFLVVAFWRFHKSRKKKADYYGVRGHATTHIEIGVVLVEVILLAGFAWPLWGRRVDVSEYPNDPNMVKVRAVGEKFKWTFHYPGVDGKFGRIDPALMSISNPLGVDGTDPNAKDDKMSAGDMVLPINRRVIVEMTSKDVIHNLALVSMRMAHDATPGIDSAMWFKPVKTGEWDIICGQLCGPGHGSMKANLVCKEEAEYDSWIKDASPAVTVTESSASKVATAQ